MTHSAAVLGAGGWGTALAVILARRGLDVMLWARQPAAAAATARQRENARYQSVSRPQRTWRRPWSGRT